MRKLQLLAPYIERKLAEIDASNRERGIDSASSANGRRLTSLDLLRACLVACLGANEYINHDLTCMVRQLAPSAGGVPLEIDGFANDTRRVPYEGIQSDIFGHVFAMIPSPGCACTRHPPATTCAGSGNAWRFPVPRQARTPPGAGPRHWPESRADARNGWPG